jgi:GGDEF domain-containing protein
MSSSVRVSSDRLALTPHSEAGHDFEQHSMQLGEALHRDIVELQQIGGIMKSTARDTDAVARFGGDEFGDPMAITVSVGVSLARGTDAISPEVLLREADRSLYKAKTAGRNRVFT